MSINKFNELIDTVEDTISVCNDINNNTSNLIKYDGDGNIPLNQNTVIKFADNGIIQSYDENHRIIFNRENDVLDIREFGQTRFINGSANPIALPSMTIENNGNIGIGYDVNTVNYTAQAKLHIFEPIGSSQGANSGTIILEHGDTGGDSTITFKSKNNSGSDYGYIKYCDDCGPQGTGLGERSQLTIGVENDSYGSSLDSVKISSNEFYRYLYINPAGASFADDNTIFGWNVYYDGNWRSLFDGYSAYLKLTSGGNLWYDFTPSTSNTDDIISLSRGFTVLNNGNFGIGVNTPEYKLDLGTGGNIRAGTIYLFGDTFGISTQPNSLRLFGLNPSGGIAFDVANQNDAMFITSGGNVGIKKTNPNESLDVNGNVLASKVMNGAFDFQLGFSDQSSRGNSGTSRALVKDFGNILVINYSGDYSGGVNIINGQFVSDDRQKKEEKLLENATETLLKLRPQKYRMYGKTDEQHQEDLIENPDAVNNSWEEAGLVAQEIYYQAPELRYIVKKDPNSNPKENVVIPDDPTIDPDYGDWGKTSASVSYNSIISYLVKSIQELHARIQILENTSNI